MAGERDILEAADLIESFAMGKSGPHDWDDFLNGSKKDSELLKIRGECERVESGHPPRSDTEWCSPEGIDALMAIATRLRKEVTFSGYPSPQASPVPAADDEPLKRRRRFWRRAIWISVAGVVVPPIYGLMGTVVGMVGAFGELSRTGEADSEALAEDVSVSLLTTMWGLVVSTVAFIFLVGVLIRFFTLPKLAGPSIADPQGQGGADRRR